MSNLGIIDGHWSGSWTKRGAVVGVEYSFVGKKGTFSSKDQAVLDYPLDKVELVGNHVELVLGGGMKFNGVMVDTTITGTFDDGDGGGRFILHRSPAQLLPYVSKDVTFGSKASRLSGTLCLPKGKGPFPAVVLLHGSGPQSRWGTLRYIADFMARNGIAALCWDQRGSGASSGQWYKSNYDDLVSDAQAGIDLLKREPKVDRHFIGVYGHSQGGTISALLANRSRDISFVIAGAPIVGKVYEQDIFRVHNILAKQYGPESVEPAMAYYRLWLDVARTGKGHEKLDAETEKVKGEKWFEAVSVPGPESYIWSYYPPIGNFDSEPLWSTIKVPVLVLFGERDEIEDVPRYELRADRQLRLANNNDFTIVTLPRARHELKVDSEPNMPFEWRRPSPGLYELLVGWIKLRFGQKSQ